MRLTNFAQLFNAMHLQVILIYIIGCEKVKNARKKKMKVSENIKVFLNFIFIDRFELSSHFISY